jgi:hypothetical protein
VYLQDGGDPRQIHKACPDLDFKSSAGVTTKITNGSKEIQRTNIPVYFGKEDSDEKV